MFKIIEKISSGPIRYPVKPGISVLPGMVGKIAEYEGTPVIDIGDANNAFGIIGNKRSLQGLSYNREDLVAIWQQRMIFRTDVFDKACEYKSGCSLYVCDGLLTSVKSKNYYVAKLTMEPVKGIIEALWL